MKKDATEYGKDLGAGIKESLKGINTVASPKRKKVVIKLMLIPFIAIPLALIGGMTKSDFIIETNYPAFTVPRGFKCRNNREINDTHTNLTTSIYCSKPSSITSPVESKRTELRALR